MVKMGRVFPFRHWWPGPKAHGIVVPKGSHHGSWTQLRIQTSRFSLGRAHMPPNSNPATDTARIRHEKVVELERELLDRVASEDEGEDTVSGTRAFILDEETQTELHDQIFAEDCKYKIQERIARGAESLLYLATDGNRQYCVKAIRNFLGKLLTPRARKKDEEKLEVSYDAKVKHLKNEFEVGCKLDQGGEIPIVRMYALRRVQPCLLELGYDLLMEYIDGNDLGDRKAVHMLGLGEKINLFFQTAIALRYMHRLGYVHLDMKPSNVMVTKGRVKLIDFGMTVPVGTKPRSITGTAGYLSPEQIVRRYADEATDIFALGITFNVIFGGKPLRQTHDDLQEKNFRMEAKFHLEKSDQPMIDQVPEVQHIPKLTELIKRCTVPQREKRIRNANTVINSLMRIAKELDLQLTEPY